jgi:hypothetical protein
MSQIWTAPPRKGSKRRPMRGSEIKRRKALKKTTKFKRNPYQVIAMLGYP